MSLSNEPHENENNNEPSSNLQRILVGLGVLLAITLTVIAALSLAGQNTPSATTPQAEAPTATATATALVTPTDTLSAAATLPPPASPTNTLPPPATLSPTHTPPLLNTDTPTPSATAVEASPTSTPTFTPAATVITVTATSSSPSPTARPASDCPLTPPDWTPYTVQSGDTMNSLAARTGQTVYDLQQANCRTDQTLRAGQTIYLPGAPATLTPVPPTLPPTSTGPSAPTPTRTGTPTMPQIERVTPSGGELGRVVTLVIQGKNFRVHEQGFRVELRSTTGVTTTQLALGAVRGDTSFEAIVPADLSKGVYDLVIINPDNRMATRENAYTNDPSVVWTPTPIPTPTAQLSISRVTPQTFRQADGNAEITVFGTGFKPSSSDFRVEIKRGTAAPQEITVVSGSGSSTQFKATIPAGNLEIGKYDLIVYNNTDDSDIKREAFDITE